MAKSKEKVGAFNPVGGFWKKPAAIGGPILSTVGGVIIPMSVTPEMDPWAEWLNHVGWTVVGVLALVLGLLWAIVGAGKRETEAGALVAALKRAREDALIDYTHKLAPLIHDLGNLAESQRVEHGRALRDRGLTTIEKMIDVPHIRLCLYELDHVESRQADSMDIPNALALRPPAVGRYDHPRENFLRNESDTSDDVFKVIDDGQARLIEDVDDPQHRLDCKDKEYKTFLNVPVKFLTEELGVLSIDAPVAKSLNKSHVLLASMVAELVAVGMLREKKNQRDRRHPIPNVLGGE